MTTIDGWTWGGSAPQCRPAWRAFVEICERHVAAAHVDGVIPGCTEIPLVLAQGDISVPMIDTTAVHAEALFAAARRFRAQET